MYLFFKKTQIGVKWAIIYKSGILNILSLILAHLFCTFVVFKKPVRLYMKDLSFGMQPYCNIIQIPVYFIERLVRKLRVKLWLYNQARPKSILPCHPTPFGIHIYRWCRYSILPKSVFLINSKEWWSWYEKHSVVTQNVEFHSVKSTCI